MDNLREVAASLGLFGKKVDLAILRAMEGDAGKAIKTEMRMGLQARRATGKTLSELDIKRKSLGSVEIGVLGSRSHIATFLESGTRPHPIEARKAKSLLIAGGQNVERVEHPGSKRFRIAGKALRTARWEVESAIIDEFSRVSGAV